MADFEKFGPKLRQLRTDASVSMGQLARSLSISVPYLSDIERGNRNPPAPEQIKAIARILKTSETELLTLARKTRMQNALDARRLPTDRYELGAALMRSIDTLSDEKMNALRALLEDSSVEEE